MSLHRIAGLVVLLASGVAGCNLSGTSPEANPEPIVQSTAPEIVTRGAASEDIDVLGLGFIDGSVARWNGDVRTTVYLSPTRLRMTLAAADLQEGSGEIDVVNSGPGGGTSDPVVLTVGNPVPRITDLSPSRAPATVTTELTLTISGADFVPGPTGSRVLWNGVPLSTVVVGPTELTAHVPDYLLQAGDNVAITVRNPAPGGGESGPTAFGVDNPLPVVTGTDPAGVPVRTDAVIDVLGNNFTYGATVWVDDTAVTPRAVSASRLTILVPGTLALGGTTLSVRVENRAPGGGMSSSVELDVWASPPRIDYLSPSRVFSGASGFTLTIVGQDFDPDATVMVDGDQRPATFVSSARIETDISAADVAAEGEVEIRVTNPGAGTEGRSVLTVLPPSEYGVRVVSERWGGHDIVISNLDGTDATTVRIATGVARVDASPVGPTAVYHGAGRVHEIDFLSSASRRLTALTSAADLVSESWPRYSPGGEWVYFAGTPGGHGSSTQIWRVRTDGSAAERVVADPGASLGFPAPSHGGERIVYSTGGAGSGPLRVWDIASASASPLGVSGLTSRWSPDDQWIVYLTSEWDLRAVRPDGSGDFALVTHLDVGYGFDFSADGASIVSTTQRGEGILIAFPSGLVESLPGLGSIASIAFFGP